MNRSKKQIEAELRIMQSFFDSVVSLIRHDDNPAKHLLFYKRLTKIVRAYGGLAK